MYAKNILFEEKSGKKIHRCLIKKNSREKINEEKMKNLVRKGLKGKINNRKVKNKKDFKKCEKFIDKI